MQKLQGLHTSFGNPQSIDLLGLIGAIFMPLATKTIFEHLASKGLPITMTLTKDGLWNHSGHVVRTNAYLKISWVWTIARQRLRHWEQSISIGKQIGSEMETEICAMCTVLAIQTTSEHLLLMELICYFSRSPFPGMLLV